MTHTSTTTNVTKPRRGHAGLVRVTVWVPPDIRRDLKVQAVIAGQTLSDYVIAAATARLVHDLQYQAAFPGTAQS